MDKSKKGWPKAWPHGRHQKNSYKNRNENRNMSFWSCLTEAQQDPSVLLGKKTVHNEDPVVKQGLAVVTELHLPGDHTSFPSEIAN